MSKSTNETQDIEKHTTKVSQITMYKIIVQSYYVPVKGNLVIAQESTNDDVGKQWLKNSR